ncbi:hypothetical protein COBT_001414 [Conglomerata obtusa]
MSLAIKLVLHILLSFQHGVILIKNNTRCDPSRICEINGLDDVVANPTNLPFLMSMLTNNCVEAAMVAGWNDHISYNYVLRSNGSLAPYQELTNHASYAFCIEKGKGCSRNNVYICPPAPRPCPPAPRPCPPMPQPCPPMPQPCPPAPRPCPPMPQPCPPAPRPCPPMPQPCPPAPRPCPPMPQPCPPAMPTWQPEQWYPVQEVSYPKPRVHCKKPVESSSSSSSSSSSDSSSTSESDMRQCTDKRPIKVCPKYVKSKKLVHKSHGPNNKCEDWVKCCVENIRVIKTFVFDESDLKDCGRIKLKEFTDKTANQVKYVELRPLYDRRRVERDEYPALLRFPRFLLRFKQFIQCKYKYQNPCLYISCEGRLYVRIHDTLYSVSFLKGTTFDDNCNFKHLELCPIRGRELNCLIQKGLAGIKFERNNC